MRIILFVDPSRNVNIWHGNETIASNYCYIDMNIDLMQCDV